MIDLEKNYQSLSSMQDFLEKKFQIQYLHQLKPVDWRSEQWILKRCTKNKHSIAQGARWFGFLFDKLKQENKLPSLKLQWINPILKYGVFATSYIPAHTFIEEYTGILRPRSLLTKSNDYCFMYPKLGFFCKRFTIDSLKAGNITRFINHSDTPNLESVALFFNGMYHIVFRSIQAINPCEQLTYHYGDIYWKGDRVKLPL